MEDAISRFQFTVADAMVPTRESVTNRDTVGTAAKVLSEHRLAALPVVETERVIGLVTPLQLLLAPAYRPVVNVMTPGIAPVTPDLPLVQAYASMMQQHVEILPVVQGGRIVGQISASAVLRKQTQQNDSLTGLPTSTALRAWAMAALERGHEISILLIDLDNFGAVNKTLGHVAGDDLLCAVAQLASRFMDEHTDLLSRYGGDEFVVATTRHHADSRRLREQLEASIILPINVGETSRNVTASIGMAGGRRAEGRERSHIAATVDDLITLASRASTHVKETKRAAEDASRRAVPADAAPEAGEVLARREVRLQLADVTVRTDEHGGQAAVTLRWRTREGTGTAAGPVHGPGLLFLVAQATLEAVRQTAGELCAYVVEELSEVPTTVDKLVVVVLSATSNGRGQFVGSARAPDSTHAVTKAILDALNRRLALVLGAPPRGGIGAGK
jgi:diguanylate cyclase (GGDEF)-like protein